MPRVTLSNRRRCWARESVLVTAGLDANFIYSSVSRMVEFRSSSRGIEIFYFTKLDTWQATDDIAQLR